MVNIDDYTYKHALLLKWLTIDYEVKDVVGPSIKFLKSISVTTSRKFPKTAIFA